jgi:hypothetical protein
MSAAAKEMRRFRPRPPALSAATPAVAPVGHDPDEERSEQRCGELEAPLGHRRGDESEDGRHVGA